LVAARARCYGRALDADMPRKTLEIEGADVPQAPNLARVRAVVTALAEGSPTLEAIADEMDISPRHVGYAARAAQTLDLLDEARRPTPRGRALVATDQESAAERAVLRRAVEESIVLCALAPGLLSATPPTKKALGARIEKLSGLSIATSEHRASDLLAWREQILDEEASRAAPTQNAAPDARGDS
jgi:hypothetical protein